MADELQALLNRIKSEGLERAEAEAKSIIEAAQKEAANIRKAAEEEAEKLRAEAKRDAAAFSSRAEATVGQAVRDVKLQLAEDLQRLVVAFLASDVKREFSDADSLKSWISKAVDTYLAKGERAIEIELGASAAPIAAKLLEELNAKAGADGIKVVDSPAFADGFTIRTDGGRVEQCFTADAVTDALARLLRPELAALTKDA